MEARVQVQDIRTIVTGVTARVDPKAEAVGFDGVVVTQPMHRRALSTVRNRWPLDRKSSSALEAENDRWNLQLTARMTEFLGYDDPGPVQATIRTPNAKPLKAVAPLPRLRIREASAWANVEMAMWSPSVAHGGSPKTSRKGTLPPRGNQRSPQTTLRLHPGRDHRTGDRRNRSAWETSVFAGGPNSQEGDLCHIGKREVWEFRRALRVIRSLALAHPELRLLIRNEPGVSKEWTRRIQDAAMEAGVENLLLYAMEK